MTRESADGGHGSTGAAIDDGKGPSGMGQHDVAVVPRFANVATFLRASQCDRPEGLDIAMFGVPFDLGSSFRSGSRHGPAQIREMSRLVRSVNALTGTAPFSTCRVADLGDTLINALDADASLRAIEDFVTEVISAGARPLAAGGDHTITLPVLRALAKRAPVALVQVDAHSDTQDSMLGRTLANGTVFRRAIEEGLLDPRLCFQVGIRGTLFKADELAWAHEAGFTIFDMNDIDGLGLQEIAKRIKHAIGDRPTYLTFDIDALDPSIAPGTGGLEPGGLSYRDALRLMHGISGLDIIGADVVEVCPPLEPGTLTSMVAANIMFEELCLISEAIGRAS